MSVSSLKLRCLLVSLFATATLFAQPDEPATPAAEGQSAADQAGGELLPGPSTAAGTTRAPALPPGHPPTDATANATVKESENRELPPGHPPTTGAGASPASSDAANPHGAIGPAKDVALADAAIPKGTIVATIVDAAGKPQSGRQVRLGRMFQSIAEGDQRTFASKVTDAEGRVEFTNQQTESNFSYRISVREGAAEYASAPFRLQRDKGQRVLLHVYPVTSDAAQARIAMRGLVYVQPRDDVFQLEVWFQVYNVSQIAWVPNGVTMSLPEGAKAFSARESMADTRFEQAGDARAELLGTFSPGQHDVRFGVQVPNRQTSSAEFQLALPPHVAEFRVITEAPKGMTMHVDGFPSVQSSTGMHGEPVLVTQKRGTDLGGVRFQLAGLPTRGSAPWFAVIIAALTAASGLYSARTTATPNQKRQRLKGELKQAKKVIVEELAALELAKRRGELGPKSYEQTRRALMNALARIIQPATR